MGYKLVSQSVSFAAGGLLRWKNMRGVVFLFRFNFWWGVSGGGLSIFFCLCSLSKWSSCNYFQCFQSREEKKKSLTAQCFLKVHVLVWNQETQKGFAELQYIHKLRVRNLCFDTCEGKKKIKYFSFSLWLCVFICVQLRVEAISLPPPAFCCLLVGPPFTKTLWTASGWLKHSQTTQWRYTLTGLCLKDNIQVCPSPHIRFKILRLFSFASKSLLKIEIFTKEKKTLFFCKNSVVKLILLQFCRFFFMFWLFA